ncbi:MAG: FAD-binding oxidoreductase [Cellulomonas sp. 73-92]|uniref:FAD-binding and (Fe-S)-binding domain-containing protein n=1 Tax=Cellulomonas sp. 73-92 TaxID=1895740 RepID=UPI000928AD4B|nr:FAD-binding and (Fe-S)-binding domain-containing protein [Cellulomonas sp. 73-92]OJV83426.1 MAG: FAD-binding oxidoreductase [Cellulomonas sp. 73-92]
MTPSQLLLEDLRASVADAAQVRTRPIDLLTHAHDASHFLLQPQASVIARDAAEVARVFGVGTRHGAPVTLRAGGTSLSGQGSGTGILLDVRRGFRDVEVLDDGARVRVQPGVTVRQVNARLAPHGRKLGPDPASEVACTLGGVIANNSSGMTCGTSANAYRTLESLTVVLADGTVVDTGAPDADERLRLTRPELYAGIAGLRDRVRGDAASVRTVRHQFSMKNTMGYGLNSFLDFDRPVDILAHLLVGSEGTLGFVAEAVLRTVPVLPRAATAFVVFDDLEAANDALPALVGTGAATLELLDAISLRVGQGLAGTPQQVMDLRVDRQAALLVEYQAADDDALDHLRAEGDRVLRSLAGAAPARFTTDGAERADLWHLRKGLYTAVAGARPSGTTALLEDVVVPVAALARTCTRITQLCQHHGYQDSVIFGHAKDGNVHFMITDEFASAASLARYRAFTEGLVDLVLGEDGSLKAEHGTGRVMAPFVRRQYGDELYDVMRQVKSLCDPVGVLNPGVVLDDDPDAHLRHIKTSPRVEEEVDRCVECGYCEPVCPSRDLTLTPRQRIVARREIARARAAGDEALAARLEADHGYSVVQTCAVDGMCQTACPVSINTGLLVKRLRREGAARTANAVWGQAARHWAGTTRVAAALLDVARAVPEPLVTGANVVARRALGADNVPLHSAELPGGGVRRARPAPSAVPEAVYLPACVNAMFGPAGGGAGVQAAVEALCARAGVTLLVPEGVDSLCCGTPWSSKGLADGLAVMRRRTLDALRAATRDGALPVICDAASCTEGIVHALEEDLGSPLTVIDAVQFVADRVLPRLPSGQRRVASLVLHPTCSSTRMGLNPALSTVAAAVADEVRVPDDWGCCAFAGDRGMLHPELTASATAREAASVAAIGGDAHASCNRTCELGMTRATGQEYRHVLELLEEVTRPEG